MGTDFRTRWKRMRETTEAWRELWSKPEASYEGELVRFPPLRCEPKPVQPGGPRVLLGAHGANALKRVARTYDGWIPLVQDPDTFREEVITLRGLTREAGRDPGALDLTALVDPGDGDAATPELLARYRDAGANRVVLFSQRMGTEVADGAALDWLERLAPTVEKAKYL